MSDAIRVDKLTTEYCTHCFFRIGHDPRCWKYSAPKKADASEAVEQRMEAGGLLISDLPEGEVPLDDGFNVKIDGATDGLEPWREAEKTIREGVNGTQLLETLLMARLRRCLGTERPEHSRSHPHGSYRQMLKAVQHLAQARMALLIATDEIEAQ